MRYLQFGPVRHRVSPYILAHQVKQSLRGAHVMHNRSHATSASDGCCPPLRWRQGSKD